jgi:hypothetical protein
VSFDGKQRMVCVPWAWKDRVREWVDRHGQVREILERLSKVYLKRLESREA